MGVRFRGKNFGGEIELPTRTFWMPWFRSQAWSVSFGVGFREWRSFRDSGSLRGCR